MENWERELRNNNIAFGLANGMIDPTKANELLSYRDDHDRICGACGQNIEDIEICAWCGSLDHTQAECPEYRQAYADKERDERMESARIEGPIASSINAGKM